MVPGSIPLTNGLTTIHVAPENLRIFWSDEAVKGRADAESGTLSANDFTSLMQATILACARRNHPELTLEQLTEVLDCADVPAVYLWVKTKGGLKPSPLGVNAMKESVAPISSDTSSTPPGGSPTTSSTG